MPNAKSVASSYEQSVLFHERICNVCSKCEIVEKKKTIWRGQIPFNLLLVGEAPGPTERIEKIPFYGQAGWIFDELVEQTKLYESWSWCVSNTILCYPDDGNGGFRAPKTEEMDACLPHLTRFMDNYFIPNQLKIIVTMGKVAKEQVTPDNVGDEYEFYHIDHPSYMNRKGGVHSQSFYEARCTLENLPPF